MGIASYTHTFSHLLEHGTSFQAFIAKLQFLYE